MSRSVAQQVSHWARIGRELERSAGISAADVRRVLEGAEEYDRISPREQAVVRAVWSARVDALRADLRLDRTYREAGYRYAELDERGDVLTIESPAPATRVLSKSRRTRRG